MSDGWPGRFRKLRRRTAIVIRILIRALIGVAFVAIPPLFPKLVEAFSSESGPGALKPGGEHAHHYGWVFYLFGAVILAELAWEIVERLRAEDQELIKTEPPVFIDTYANIVTSAGRILQDVDTYSHETAKATVLEILASIRSVAGMYLPDRRDLQLNVNLMLPQAFSQENIEAIGTDLYFVDGDRKLDSYSGLLKITHWANDSHCAPSNFALPVAKDRRQLLFGAPRAFVLGDVQVIRDIDDRHELDDLVQYQSHDVNKDIRSYLGDRTSFKSFISLRLAWKRTNIGVINIQANKANIFGGDDQPEKLIEVGVAPLLIPLAIVVERFNKTAAERDATTPHDGRS